MEERLNEAMRGALEVLPDGSAGNPGFLTAGVPALASVPEGAAVAEDADVEERDARSFASASSRVSGMSGVSAVMRGMKNRDLYREFREYTVAVKEILRENRKEQRGLRWFLREMRDNIDGGGVSEPIAFDETDIAVTEDMIAKLRDKRSKVREHYRRKRQLVVSDLMNLERVLQVRSAKLATLMTTSEYGHVMRDNAEFKSYWVNVAREMEGDIKDLRSEAGGGLEDLKRSMRT